MMCVLALGGWPTQQTTTSTPGKEEWEKRKVSSKIHAQAFELLRFLTCGKVSDGLQRGAIAQNHDESVVLQLHFRWCPCQRHDCVPAREGERSEALANAASDAEEPDLHCLIGKQALRLSDARHHGCTVHAHVSALRVSRRPRRLWRMAGRPHTLGSV